MYILRDMRVLDMYVSIMHQGVTVSHNIHPGISYKTSIFRIAWRQLWLLQFSIV